MNKNQQKYAAFMESVCKEFNCPEMLPALNAGFKAFCEASECQPAQGSEPDPQMVNVILDYAKQNTSA